MIKDFIVATQPNGEKVLIQVHNIFSIVGNNEGCLIQSIGARDNAIEVTESLATIIEKIDKKI